MTGPRTHRSAPVYAGLALLWPAVLVGQGELERSSLPIPLHYTWMEIASGDFNGDGLPDLALLGVPGGSRLLAGDGAGGFTETHVFEFGNRNRPQVADLDGDGFDDLVSTSFNPSLGLETFYGLPEGLLGPFFSPTPGAVLNLNLRELDDDDFIDGVVAMEEPGGATVASIVPGSAGPFGLEPRMRISGITEAPFLATGDFNGDLAIDLAAWRWGWQGPRLVIREGLGDGEFSPDDQFATESLDPAGYVRWSAMVAADFDGDGADEAVFYHGRAIATSVLYALDWTRDDNYTVAQIPHFVPLSRSDVDPFRDVWTRLAQADIDSNGTPDVLLLAGYTDRVAVLRGAGEGTLDFDRCDIVFSGEASSFTFGDFNADGALDIAGILPREGKVELIFSAFESCVPSGPAFLRGDTDADGERSLGDAVAILTYLFAGDAAPTCLDAADIDDDGEVLLSDGVSLLTHLFGGGPGPAPPDGACGIDGTADGLSCEEHAFCAR